MIFRKLRAMIMGVIHPSSLLTVEPTPVKERVEKGAVLTVIKKNSKTINLVSNPSYDDVVKLRGS